MDGVKRMIEKNVLFLAFLGTSAAVIYIVIIIYQNCLNHEKSEKK
jgi:hypothetical protein